MSGSIPQDFIRDIVDTTDIVSLVDSYLPLKRKGKDHWGICPFCEDGKNPSFSVSEQKQFYYCFKCRATGNVIGFLQSHQGYDFIESIEALAARAGMEVPYENSNASSVERDPIYDALRLATEIFEKNLSKKVKILTAIILTGLVFKEYEENFEIGHTLEEGFDLVALYQETAHGPYAARSVKCIDEISVESEKLRVNPFQDTLDKFFSFFKKK